jgi:quercetin dioxygenase-like cupin family protein
MPVPIALETILQLGLPDRAIDGGQIPWVPQSDRVWMKPLRFDLTNGRWINLLKIMGGGVVSRHRHAGGSVIAYTVEGRWRYLERSWEAKPGTLIWEPPGDIHTLVVDNAPYTITLFAVEGVIQYLDDQDRVTYQDDVFTKLERYRKYCRENGIAEVDMIF